MISNVKVSEGANLLDHRFSASSMTGIYISITGEFIENWRERARLVGDETEKHDVVITHNDKRVEMTFEEFLLKVGLLT